MDQRGEKSLSTELAIFLEFFFKFYFLLMMAIEETKLTMKTIIDEIRSIQENLKEDIRRSDENIGKKLDAIQSTIQPLQKDIATHTREIYFLKQEMHRNRLIVFGLEGEPNEPKSVLELKLQSLFGEKLLLTDFSLFELDFCKRLGSRYNRNKPILVGLTTERRKEQILRAGKLLKETPISIREDFPPEIRQKRKHLLEEMRKLRAEGKFAIVKYDTLITNDKETNVNSTRQTGQKRGPSQSPGLMQYKRPNLIATSAASSETATPNRNDSLHQTDSQESYTVQYENAPDYSPTKRADPQNSIESEEKN